MFIFSITGTCSVVSYYSESVFLLLFLYMVFLSYVLVLGHLPIIVLFLFLSNPVFYETSNSTFRYSKVYIWFCCFFWLSGRHPFHYPWSVDYPIPYSIICSCALQDCINLSLIYQGMFSYCIAEISIGVLENNPTSVLSAVLDPSLDQVCFCCWALGSLMMMSILLGIITSF